MNTSIIIRGQIVTDTCTIMFQGLFENLYWNQLYHYANENVLFASPLFSLPFIRSKTVQFMEDLPVFTALNHSGSFRMNFVKFQNNKYVIYWLRVGPYGEKLCFSLYGPRHIYIYIHIYVHAYIHIHIYIHTYIHIYIYIYIYMYVYVTKWLI